MIQTLKVSPVSPSVTKRLEQRQFQKKKITEEILATVRAVCVG
jgi:broad-specificity NMP kinase